MENLRGGQGSTSERDPERSELVVVVVVVVLDVTAGMDTDEALDEALGRVEVWQSDRTKAARFTKTFVSSTDHEL